MKKIISLLILCYIGINSSAQVTDLAPGNYKVIDIGIQSTDYTKSVILLHEIYDGIKLTKNYTSGTITALRGSAGSNDRTNVVQINTSSAYTHVYGSIIGINGDGEWKLKTLKYNGKKYMAIEVPFRNDRLAHSIRFAGWTSSTGENMKFINYETSGTFIASCGISDMQTYTPNMAEYHDVSKFIINSNVGIGTNNLQEKLNLDGNINMVGSNRRIYLGGIYGSTYGIAYNSTYPNYGIFYTEGNPDHVSISPNGNATNGVLNVYGDGKVGIGTKNPSAKFHVYDSEELGGNNGDYRLITKVGMRVGNTANQNLWSYRDASTASNWYYFRLWNGISIDASYGTPTTSRTWWQRDPYNNIQSWGTSTDTYMTIDKGKVGIGTTTIPTGYKLAVNGKIKAKEVKVTLDGWSDFVFKDNYKPKTLAEVENFINQNKHLPDVPSAAEVEENGVNLGEMNAVLLQKIEELTLYTIDLNKKYEEQIKLNNQQNNRITELENIILK